MIKAVIFDVGGVLLRTLDRSYRFNLEHRLDLDEWQSEEIVFNSDMGTKAQLGEITDAELWRWVGRRLALSEQQLDEFRRDFWSGDVIDGDLVDVIRRLKASYQTAIISNATDALRESLTSTYAIADAFDLIVVSAEERIMKPDREIYERTLQRLDRPAAEAVFIDDNSGNIAAARELGMAGILFTPTTDLGHEFAALGIDVPKEPPDIGPGMSRAREKKQ